MRVAIALIVFAGTGRAQFKTSVPLVVAPTTITDSKGRFVDGLTPQDLILYDNNVPQEIQTDWAEYPISLVIAVQTSANSRAVIDKLSNAGILLTQLLAAYGGETAVISLGEEVRIRQEFTTDPDLVTRSLRMLRPDQSGAPILDGIRKAAQMLESRPAGRRRVLLMIAEKRDSASTSKLPEVMERVQGINAGVWWLTFSPFLQPFTAKPKTVEDMKPEAERIKRRECALCPKPDKTPVPPDLGPGGLLFGVGELVRMGQADLSSLFTKTTGGSALSFLTKNALERAIQEASATIHRQYILSFVPKGAEPGRYHAIRVEVRNRPGLKVQTREGYWAGQ